MKTLPTVLLGLVLTAIATNARAQNMLADNSEATGKDHAFANVIQVPLETTGSLTTDTILPGNLPGIADANSITINSAYPNPVISDVQLNVLSGVETTATLRLIDLTGHTALERPVKLVNGNNHFEINMDDMSGGVYQLIVQTDNKRIGYKLVKAR